MGLDGVLHSPLTCRGFKDTTSWSLSVMSAVHFAIAKGATDAYSYSVPVFTIKFYPYPRVYGTYRGTPRYESTRIDNQNYLGVKLSLRNFGFLF